MTRTLRAERGSAIVTALLMVTLMLTISITAIAFVDSQQRESGTQRKRESTFNLSEGVLNTQIFLLSRAWPGTSATAYPATCSKANATDARCPDDPRLAASYRGPDYNNGLSWETEIRDNVTGSENYYDDAVMGGTTAPSWDRNGDSFLWVRSKATLPDGKDRVLVALVKAEVLATNFPDHAVIAGSIDVTQNGNHTYLSTTDTRTGLSGRVAVTCSPVTSSSCVNEGKDIQIAPASVEAGFSTKPALAPEVVERLREQARVNGTYYAKGTCPSTLQGNEPGEVVFIEYATGCTAHNVNTAVYNTAAKPGVVVIGSGEFLFQNPLFYGLVYHVNGSDGVGTPLPAGTPAVSTKGNGVIVGAVIIDNSGKLEIGNNNGTKGFPGNLVFDSGAKRALKAFGTAGIVQNSFREIVPQR